MGAILSLGWIVEVGLTGSASVVLGGVKWAAMMGTRTSRIPSGISYSGSGKKAKSIVEVSPTALRERLVLKWRTGFGALAGSVVGRFECSIAVLKARELTSSWALRREMSWDLGLDGYRALEMLGWVRKRAYILLRARDLNFPLLALCTERGDIARKIEHRALLGKNGRGICCWAGHMKMAGLLVGATGYGSQCNELGRSRCRHAGRVLQW